MDIISAFARVVLAIVFLAAAAMKLRNPLGVRATAVDFGVPHALALPVARVLPAVEVAVAVALLPVATAWWGALAALGVLAVFSSVIGVALLRHRRPNCNCFGDWSASPIGWRTLFRNAVLMGLATLVVVTGPTKASGSLVGWVGDLSAGERVLLALSITAILGVAAVGLFTWQLFLQHGRLLARLDAVETGRSAPASPASHRARGMAIGTPAPDFALTSIDGAPANLRSLTSRGRPTLVVFTDPGCGPCKAMAPDLARWQQQHQERLTVALISRGSPEDGRRLVEQHGLDPSLFMVQRDSVVSDQYQAYGTPSALVVGANASVASEVVGGSRAITALVSRVTAAPALHQIGGNGGQNGHAHAAERKHLAIGTTAPEVELPNLDGRTVRLTDYRGRPTVLLFWRPSCGFCQRMLDDVKAFESSAADDAVQLLVVSTGSIDENRAMGLRSEVLLEAAFGTGQAFGASGTPSGLLIDGSGAIASSLAVGAPALLNLLRAGNVPSPERV